MPRVLFVCSRNRRRSPTAERLYQNTPGVEALSAGTAPDAEVRVSDFALRGAFQSEVGPRSPERLPYLAPEQQTGGEVGPAAWGHKVRAPAQPQPRAATVCADSSSFSQCLGEDH